MNSPGTLIFIIPVAAVCAAGLFLHFRRIWYLSSDARHAALPSSAPAPQLSSFVDPQDSSLEDEQELEEYSDPTAADLIAEGDGYLREFDYDSAIESYEAAQDAVTDQFGRDSLEFVDLLVKTEDAWFALDIESDIDEPSCKNYLRALSIMERCLGVFDARLLPVLNRIAAFYILINKPSEAESMVRRQQRIEQRDRARKAQQELSTGTAVAITTASAPASEPEVSAREEVEKKPFAGLDTGDKDVDARAAEGDKAFADRAYDTAVECYEEALNSAKSVFGHDSVRLVPILARLVSAFHARDIMEDDDSGSSYSDPFDNARIALSILVKAHGATDEQLLPFLIDMAAFSDLEGDHYKADLYLAMFERIENAARSVK